MKRLFLLELGLVWALAACGGADQSTLLADGGGGATDGGGGGQDVTVPPKKDSGPPDVVVQDVVVQDVVAVDVPVGPPTSTIQCGSTTCDAKTQICCFHPATQQGTCVNGINNCNGFGDVPVSCSSDANCASQGTPSYVCCANVGGQGTGNCSNSAIATDVSCQPDCTQQNQVPVGCDTNLQNCADPQLQCFTSQCTLPGYNICI